MRTAGHDELAEMLEEEDSSCSTTLGLLGSSGRGTTGAGKPGVEVLQVALASSCAPQQGQEV